ncbi:MAG: A/G-specific adenine glycosylase [Erysipelotrichaceae bacterium]|nr:A/G-specific adenine glycosylase [Erysipelotrichaceae bacterium]
MNQEYWIEPLIAWYEKEKRDLPWRKQQDAYAVWISEIMLQQTRVEAVIPYYLNWMKVFPTMEILAKADQQQVYQMWQGLGYYSRAKNIHDCAIECVNMNQGKLPASYQKLLVLPGIGEYTAAAISSICFHEAQSAVDGNVLRVMSRLWMDDQDISKQKTKQNLKRRLDLLIPKENPGAFNQALMELGATICIPNGAARCNICPLASFCLSYKTGKVYEYPIKTSKKSRKIEQRIILVLQYQDQYYIQKRPSQGLLANLYEFINIEKVSQKQWKEDLIKRGIKIQKIKKLTEYRHVFTHIEWQMNGYLIQVEQKIEGIWVTKKQMEEYPFASCYTPFKNLLTESF